MGVVVKRLEYSIRELFDYKPTEFQEHFHRFRKLHAYTTNVAHRREGKTEGSVMELYEGALTCPLRLPVFDYVAPTLKQAKEIVWDKLKLFANIAKSKGLTNIKINESNAKIMIDRGGDIGIATIKLGGWEEPDSLRGPHCDGLVADEAADMKEGVWGNILVPKLSDRGGWAIITGTVKGLDQFYDFYCRGISDDPKDEHWGSIYLPIEKTRGKIPWLTEENLDVLRSGMSDTQWDQEMNCNWNASCDNILITLKMIERAQERNLRDTYKTGAHLLGIDPAGGGTDPYCIAERWGARFIGTKKFNSFGKGFDNYLASYIVGEVNSKEIDAVFIDGTGGYAGGIVVALENLGCQCPVYEINFKTNALDPAYFVNIRAEMWWKMAKCIGEVGSLYKSMDLSRELSCVSYERREGRIILEPKEKIRLKLGRSPNEADAYAVTFAMPVLPLNLHFGKNGAINNNIVRDDFKL